MLKAEEENVSMMNCFRIGKFSSVGSQGKVGVSVGGRVLRGHLHSWSACVGTPLLAQAGGVVGAPLLDQAGGVVGDTLFEEAGVVGAVTVAPAIVAGGQLPMEGKFLGNVWSCSQQSLDR